MHIIDDMRDINDVGVASDSSIINNIGVANYPKVVNDINGTSTTYVQA